MSRQQYYLVILSTLLCVFGLGIWTLPAGAQQVAVAQVSGQVTDSNGAVIADARIVMTETDKGVIHTTSSNSEGNYVLPGLPVGNYRLEVSSSGFKTQVRSGMVLQISDHLTINVMLEIGSATETVEVLGGVETVQTDTAAVSSVIESQRITELPLNGRMATQLVLLAGAAVDAPSGDEKGSKSFISSQTYSVAGGQHNGTNYLLDGSDWNDPIFNVNMPFPIPDALQEFSVETSALPARNGIHPGGTVNAVTKSGSNHIHGSLFEYYRSANFNAARRNFGNGAQFDSLLRNQYGGTIGGKIIANKLFYFGSYQTTRAKSASTPSGNQYTATQAMLTGDFTAKLNPGPCTATQKNLTGFAGNVIPTAQFDPAAVKLFSSGLMPISTDPCGLFVYAIPSVDNEDQAVGKVDWARSDRQTMYFRYLLDDYRHPAPFDPHNLAITGASTSVGNWERGQGFALGHAYTFNSALTNAFHFGFSRRRDNRGGNPTLPTLKSLGVNMYSPVNHYMALTIPNYFTIGCGTCTDAHLNANTWQGSNDLDWLKGKHHFAFGGNVMRNQTNTSIGYLFAGSATFDASIGDAMANFLLGRYSAFGQSNPQNVNYRVTMLGLYAQDTYKLTPNFTVTAGVRWEPTIWPTDTKNRGSQFTMANFVANTHSTVYPNGPAGTLFHGDAGVPTAFTNNHMMNFSPRIGIAWDPRGNGTSSLRAGYGILYDSSMVWLSQRLTSNPPVTNEIDTTAGCGTFSNPWLNYSLATGCGSANANQNPFPVTNPGSTASFPGNTLWVSLPQNLRPMYMQQWNLSYEQQFLKEWAFSVAYLGSRTLHIPTTIDLNAPVASAALCAAQPVGAGSTKHPAGVCWTDNETARRSLRTLFPATDARTISAGQYGSLLMTDDHQFANYNAMLATIRHRFSNGLNFHANYTYSKCLSSADFNGDIRSATFMVQGNPRLDYGVCNLDVRNSFNSTLVAASPFHGSGWKKWVLGGWQLAPAVRAYNGLPGNITNGNDAVLADNINLGRAVRVPGQPLYTKKWVSGAACGTGPVWCYQYYNPAAFTVPNLAVAGYSTAAPYNYTPVQRNMVHQPNVWNVDASLSRAFPIREGKDLTFRFDMFNALNHYNPSISANQGVVSGLSWTGTLPTSTITPTTNARFGQVTSPNSVGFLPSIYDPRILQGSLKLNF